MITMMEGLQPPPVQAATFLSACFLTNVERKNNCARNLSPLPHFVPELELDPLGQNCDGNLDPKNSRGVGHWHERCHLSAPTARIPSRTTCPTMSFVGIGGKRFGAFSLAPESRPLCRVAVPRGLHDRGSCRQQRRRRQRRRC